MEERQRGVAGLHIWFAFFLYTVPKRPKGTVDGIPASHSSLAAGEQDDMLVLVQVLQVILWLCWCITTVLAPSILPVLPGFCPRHRSRIFYDTTRGAN